jgi:integrase
MSNESGRKTAYPGVWRLGKDRYRVRTEYTCPKTGKRKEIDRVVHATSPAAASKMLGAFRLEKVQALERPARRRLVDYATSWLTSKLPTLKPSTRRVYADALELHVLPVIGEHYIDAVTRDDIVALRDGLKGEPITVNGRIRVLRTLFRDAAAELQIPDPTARVGLVSEKREENATKVLSAGDLGRLLEAMREHTPTWYPLALVLATTGMRFGEASALKWSDVDDDARVIRVRRAHWRGHVSSPKTDAVRTVPLTAELGEVLRAHRREQLANQAPGLAEGWLFTTTVGTLYTPTALRKPLARAAKAAELERTPSPHWFRHTLSDLLRQAATGQVQRAITGHVTEEMSEHYSHVAIDEKRTAVTRAFDLVASAPPKSGDPSGVSEDGQKKAR